MKKKVFEKQVAEGLTPSCYECGSNITLGDKQTGETGSEGYQYQCTDPDCEVKGFVYIHWYFVLIKALKGKIVQLGLTAIASLTIAGGLGIYFDLIKVYGNNNKLQAEMPSDVKAPVMTDKAENKLSKIIEDKNKEIKGFKKLLIDKDQIVKKREVEIINLRKKQKSRDEEISLALYYSSPNMHDPSLLNNSKKAMDILFSTLKNQEDLPDNRKKEIIEGLIRAREKIRFRENGKEDFKFLIKKIDEQLSDGRKYLQLGRVYWAYKYIGNEKKRNEQSLHFFLAHATKNKTLKSLKESLRDIKENIKELIKLKDNYLIANKDWILPSLEAPVNADNFEETFTLIKGIDDSWPRDVTL